MAVRRVRCLLDELSWRGIVQDVTRRDALASSLAKHRHTVYAGVDPTAKALHIGHLVPLLTLLHFQLRGHHIVPLIGGATGRVGDPSGRLTERQPANVQQIQDNCLALTESIKLFFQRAGRYAESRSDVEGVTEPTVVSNLSWHGEMSLLDFLQRVGIHARVNTMMNRDSVRTRLESQQGISFTEFTYQLLQAYDFYHLHKHLGCTIQVGGSDQWGNIVAGLELINKLNPHRTCTPHADAYGLTTPLLTTSTGEKFGKSAGNAVWLDPDLTSVFDFYQYFLKVTDADVRNYLKLFTLLPSEEIDSILAKHEKAPESRIAQYRLASEITEMVHEESGLRKAVTMSNLVFGSDYSVLKASDVISSFENDPRLVKVTKEELTATPLPKLASKYGLVASNSAAKSLVTSRGLYYNNSVVSDVHLKITDDMLLEGRILVLRAGKDKHLIFAAD